MFESDDELSVTCRSCGAPYTQRVNLTNGKMLWFPTCNHIAGKDSAIFSLDAAPTKDELGQP